MPGKGLVGIGKFAGRIGEKSDGNLKVQRATLTYNAIDLRGRVGVRNLTGLVKFRAILKVCCSKPRWHLSLMVDARKINEINELCIIFVV